MVNNIKSEEDLAIALGLKRNLLKKEHIEFINNIIEPCSFVDGLFYYKNEDVNYITTELIDIREAYSYFADKTTEFNILFPSFRKSFVKSFQDKCLVIPSVGTLCVKSTVVDIDYSLFHKLNPIVPNMLLSSVFSVSRNKGYLRGTASKLLGITVPRLDELAHEGRFIKYIDSEHTLVDKEDVDYWYDFKNRYISLGEILEEVDSPYQQKFNISRRYKFDCFHTVRKNGTLNSYNLVDQNDTCFPTGYAYVDISKKEEVLYLIQTEIDRMTINSLGSRIDKLEYEINSFINPNIDNTLNHLRDYGVTRFSKYRSILFNPIKDCLVAIAMQDKELKDWSDEEVKSVIDNLPTRYAQEEFCLFIAYLKGKEKTKFNKDYNYNRTVNTDNKLEGKPYTEDQYLRFGFLVLSDSHIWYSDYLNKAISKRKYASVWLYSVLHYTCAWRGIDMRLTLPHPRINMTGEEFIDKLQNDEFSKDYFISIADEVYAEIKYKHLRAKKTNKLGSKKQPKLVMEIPESIKSLVGMLLGLCEAHYQISNDVRKKGLITRDCNDRKLQEEFFGDEFINIFKGDSFSNLRASKNFEIMTLKNSEEEELGTGYILASIARSHKVSSGGKAKTTSIYLEYYHKMEEPEAMLSELFERGVCSFVPYMLVKLLKGEDYVKTLEPEKQTALISETIGDNTPYDLEMAIQVFEDAVERGKSVVNEIVAEYSNDGEVNKEAIRKILRNISSDLAPGKANNVNCIAVAQGKGCIYKERKHCIGCGQEVYFKSYLNELGSYFSKVREAAYNSKTKGSKMKNVILIKKVLLPIIQEIFVTLKDVYKIEDIEKYKGLLGVNKDSNKGGLL